jgi:hypothetical protein
LEAAKQRNHPQGACTFSRSFLFRMVLSFYDERVRGKATGYLNGTFMCHELGKRQDLPTRFVL